MVTTASPSVHTVRARTLGRYLVTPAADNTSAPLLVGFHGYGENAERHHAALLNIPGIGAWRVASVQALHRFYERRTGSVVASWMTSQDREQAIEDNLAYVSEVVTASRLDGAPDGPLVYAGFSQGVAMAYRAGLRAGHRCDGLVVLAGDVPPELQDDPPDRWPPVLLGCGRTDHWYTETKLQADLTFFASHTIAHETVVFEGGHEWHADFLQAAGRFLDAVRNRARGGAPARR